MFVLALCGEFLINNSWKNRNRKTASAYGKKREEKKRWSWSVSENNNLRLEHLFASKYICHLKVVVSVFCFIYHLCAEVKLCVHIGPVFFCAMHKCVYAAQEAKHQEHWMSANRMQHSQNPLLLPIIATIITLQVLQCAHVSTRFSTIFCHFFISLVLELLSFYKRHIPTVSMQKWIWINPKSL